LAKINYGIDVRGGDARSWSQDQLGHGTPCAGIIGAASDTSAATPHGVRGIAQDAELHICRLPHDARCSDLVAALDYCLQAGIDIACLGFGCRRGSAIVEQRIMAAKQQGVAMVAAAGNAAAAVQFPACSPHVLAVGAVGEVGTYPQDSPQAAQAAAGMPASGGLFVPQFSCRGPELDLCAPGVAVVSCQSPDGYAACDGTSLAAAHVAALAALMLAHHGDFQRDFSDRNGRRVERLFQILKDAAQPVADPALTGAGLPDAARALGFASQPWPLGLPLDAGLEQMRHAITHGERLHSGLGETRFAEAIEPPRGPAAVTHLPLTPPLPTTMMEGQVGIDALKAAMRRAGLSASR
jgi:subtilisin family serine protease